MKYKYELVRRKRMAKLGALKGLWWLIIVIIVVAYHLFWLTSLFQISFATEGEQPNPQSFIFQAMEPTDGEENLNESLDEVDHAVDQIFDPIFGVGPNMTDGFNAILCNDTLISPVESTLGTQINTLDDLHAALINPDIPYSLKEAIFQQLWHFELPRLLPAEAYQPVDFYIKYEGTMPLGNVLVFVDVTYDETIRVLTIEKNLLERGDTLNISINIGELFQQMIQVAFENLVNATNSAILNDAGTFEDDMLYYMGEEFLSVEMDFRFGFNILLGFYPVAINIDVNVTSLIQALQGGVAV